MNSNVSILFFVLFLTLKDSKGVQIDPKSNYENGEYRRSIWNWVIFFVEPVCYMAIYLSNLSEGHVDLRACCG